MKKALNVLVLVALAGCGGSGGFKGEFVTACTESGDATPEFCECMADRADETLTDEQKEYILASMKDEPTDMDAEAAMAMENQEELGRFMAGAFECGMAEADQM